MTTKKFQKQVESLNAAALHFGSKGYHVEVSIFGNVNSATLSIFYTKKSMTKDINLQLCMFQDEGDVIEHKYFPTVNDSKGFHIMKLRKE